VRPDLSVLLPCHNAATTLGETISSLEAQTFSDFETIAVDDASTDDTRLILDEWAGRDPRVRVITGPGNGIVPALQLACREARGVLLARMDADDIAAPERLATQVSLLDREPGLAGCGAHVELFPAADVGSGYRRYEAWINSLDSVEDVVRNACIECPIAHPTLVLRQSVMHIGTRPGRKTTTSYCECWPLAADSPIHPGRHCSAGGFGRIGYRWSPPPTHLRRSGDARYIFFASRFCQARDRWLCGEREGWASPWPAN